MGVLRRVTDPLPVADSGCLHGLGLVTLSKTEGAVALDLGGRHMTRHLDLWQTNDGDDDCELPPHREQVS